MPYVHKIINKEEKLIGIARLHWIYILKGVGWFFALGAMGWLFDALLTWGVSSIGNMTSGRVFLTPLLSLSGGVMTFMLVGGFIMFMLYVIKVLTTEIALLDRRVIHKSGWIFIDVKQIDVEEIRGENLDLGLLGRFLGYGYIMLDCRFIGDVKLPAIDNPERFIRALHYERAHAQDALNLVVGKSGTVTPIHLSQEGDADMNAEKNQQQPEVEPPKPGPEIQPPQPDQIPVPPNEPQPDPGQQPLAQEQSSSSEATKPQQQEPGAIPETKEQIQKAALETAQIAAVTEKLEEKAQDNAHDGHAATVDPETVAEIIKQVTPQIAQQVVQQMTEQGLISEENDHDKNVDNDLIHVFDEAALDKDGKPHDPNNKLEYAIH